MRIQRLHLLCVVIVVAAVMVMYFGPSLRLRERIEWLASQPSAQTAFAHAESGRSDALVALISVVVFTPIVGFFAVVAFMLLVRVFETFVALVHLPAWVSTPTVGVFSVALAYVTSSAWLPPSLSVLALLARAYVVYVSGTPPLSH
jgi:hypothetical protein